MLQKINKHINHINLIRCKVTAISYKKNEIFHDKKYKLIINIINNIIIINNVKIKKDDKNVIHLINL